MILALALARHWVGDEWWILMVLYDKAMDWYWRTFGKGKKERKKEE